MQRRVRPTIKDVAKAAGVSPTTVSHALNGKGTVSPDTALRIQQLAAEIGYRPSPIAQGLQHSRLGLIGLVIRPLRSLDTFLPEGVDYFLRVAGAAALAAMERGYSMMLIDDPSKPGAPFSALAADAYIVTDPFENDPVLTLLAEQRIPFVTVGADPARPGQFVEMCTFDRDDTLEVLEHLRSAGASQIALVTGTDRNTWNYDAELGYREWCAQSGQDPTVIAVPEVAGASAGETIAAALFSGPEQTWPDAVYCLTGRHAAGFSVAAQRRGLRVPEDVLIAAGSEAEQNRISSPSITSLNLQPELTGQRATAIAVALAEGRTPDVPLESPRGVLTIRDSTSRAQ